MLHAAPVIMMTPSSELSFDCKPYMQPTQKLEEFLARLEEERLKIDAFKRELPLCMQLLNNAMEASRQQLQSQRSMNEGGRPVLEEFIPLKINTSSEIITDQQNNSSSDKANWMTSAQLWNQESETTRTPSPKENNDHMKISLNGKQRVINGGAFVPFSSKDNRSFGTPFPELALASSVSQKEEMELDHVMKNSSESNSRRENLNNSGGAEKEQVLHGAANTTTQAQRKARRCWSPDLHRRFVNALQMLGGSQLATPKQIRELMKVDGLTNDEVKSHLQKYRLHTRRPSPNSQSNPGTPQVVVLGGIWVPPEYAAAAAAHGGAQATALYGAAHTNAAHHVSSVFCSAPPQVAHEIYPAIAAPHQPPNHHIHHHHQLHVYNKPQGNNTPDSDAQGGAGDQSESIEDGKSESGSWKADSGGENGGERKKREGEESNASVIMSLKF